MYSACSNHSHDSPGATRSSPEPPTRGYSALMRRGEFFLSLLLCFSCHNCSEPRAAPLGQGCVAFSRQQRKAPSPLCFAHEKLFPSLSAECQERDLQCMQSWGKAGHCWLPPSSPHPGSPGGTGLKINTEEIAIPFEKHLGAFRRLLCGIEKNFSSCLLLPLWCGAVLCSAPPRLIPRG